MRVVAFPALDTAENLEFEEIFNAYSRLVYRTAYAVTGRHEDAEDVVQTIFMRLARREVSSEVLRNPRPYLYRSAVNASLNVIRSRKRDAIFQDDAQLEHVPTPEAVENDENLHRLLREAIAQLKPKAAEILLLRYVHNLSDAEIAKMLGVSRGTVALKLFRLRARLKKLLSVKTGGPS